MHINLNTRPPLDQFARATGVIQVDVGEENGLRDATTQSSLKSLPADAGARVNDQIAQTPAT
jgi:hypothetical protein